MEYYAPPHALARAYNEAYMYENTPVPNAYLLPPYQASTDSLGTRSSLLSLPPAHMRGYGMPEYLWSWFGDWRDAPHAMRPRLIFHIARGFALRWPRMPATELTAAQVAWCQRHPPGTPMTMIEVCLPLPVLPCLPLTIWHHD